MSRNSDSIEPAHRHTYHPAAERIRLRDGEGEDVDVDVDLDDVAAATDEDGLFTVRLPIASTGEVRNEGDSPLSRDELRGLAEQIEAGAIGVFIDHGDGDVGGSRYSAVEKIGEWAAPELVDADRAEGATLLEADARLMDPETLPAATGQLRESVAALKEQVKRDLSLAASIGWGVDDSAPGGLDLMEASFVGIPADPRTTNEADGAVATRGADSTDAEDWEATARDAYLRPTGTDRRGIQATGREPTPRDDENLYSRVDDGRRRETDRQVRATGRASTSRDDENLYARVNSGSASTSISLWRKGGRD